jgi:outer membrane protein OmpA-like peptidoglycan-associated protein
MATQKYSGKPLTVTIGQAATVELPPRVFRVRLTGMLFESDKAFLLPGAMHGIQSLVDYYAAHPNMAVLVTGHTDTVGPAGYNLLLSQERAEAIAFYLQDNVDEWMKWYSGRGGSQLWGVREDQLMLSTVLDSDGDTFYHGPIHGGLDTATRTAYRDFQIFWNDNGPGQHSPLRKDGTPDQATRKALVQLYQSLDGTTLPKNATVLTHGCGEFHNDVPRGNEVDEPRNRRVEVFLFDDAVDPPAQKTCPSPSGCSEYAIWKDRSRETVDFERTLCKLVVKVVTSDGRPLKGAEVRVSRDEQATRTGLSDEHGYADFHRLMPGAYTVTARKDRFTQLVESVQVSAPDDEADVDPMAGDDQKDLPTDGDDGFGKDQAKQPPKSSSTSRTANFKILSLQGTTNIAVVPIDQIVSPYTVGPPLINARVNVRDAGTANFDPDKAQTSTRKIESGETQPSAGLFFTNTGDVAIEVTHGDFTQVTFVRPGVQPGDLLPLEMRLKNPLTADERCQRVVVLAKREADEWEANFRAAGVTPNKNLWPYVDDYFHVVRVNTTQMFHDRIPAGVVWPNKGAPGESTEWCVIFATWCWWMVGDPAVFYVPGTGGGPSRDGRGPLRKIGFGRPFPTDPADPDFIRPGDIARFTNLLDQDGVQKQRKAEQLVVVNDKLAQLPPNDPKRPALEARRAQLSDPNFRLTVPNHHGVVVEVKPVLDDQGVAKPNRFTVVTVEGNVGGPQDAPNTFGKSSVVNNSRPLIDPDGGVAFYYRWEP